MNQHWAKNPIKAFEANQDKTLTDRKSRRPFNTKRRNSVFSVSGFHTRPVRNSF